MVFFAAFHRHQTNYLLIVLNKSEMKIRVNNAITTQPGKLDA